MSVGGRFILRYMVVTALEAPDMETALKTDSRAPQDGRLIDCYAVDADGHVTGGIRNDESVEPLWDYIVEDDSWVLH